MFFLLMAACGASEVLGIDMGNGHTGGNSLLAMLNCSVECARKLESQE